MVGMVDTMQLNDFRVKENEIETLKKFLGAVIYSYESGACFFVTDRNKVLFKIENQFSIPGLEAGSNFSPQGPAAQAMAAGKLISVQIPKEVYGIRLFAIAGPVWNDEETEITGAWVLPVPRQHTIVKAFEAFAPVLAELLPEGGFLYLTDRKKFLKRQASAKFDMANIHVGEEFREGSTADLAIKTKNQSTLEIDASVYGFPVRAVSAPMFDENGKEVVGSFGLALPRKLALDLKNIVDSQRQGLESISAVIQQITESANEINTNQQMLHAEIGTVSELVKKINDVMAQIKNIAEQTNMLGLNAAIEAARAGESGRGFSVVAEEIRNLSELSKNTVSEISELTRKIEASMRETGSASTATLSVAQQTAASTEEVNAGIEELTAVSQKLADMASAL